MPASLTYPGVYVEEIKSGVRTITGVATSIAAFVGSAERGPVNDPTTIFSFGEFERNFGGLDLDHSMSFAVRDFYLNGGSQAIIVRLVNVPVAAAGPAPAPGPGPAPAAAVAPAIAQIALPTGAAAPNDNLTLVASSPGAWGNQLQAIIDTKNTRDKGASKKLFNLTVLEIDANNTVVQTEKYLNLSIDDSDPQYAPRQLKQSSSLVRVLRNDQDTDWLVPNVLPKDTKTDAKGNAIPATVSKKGVDGVTADGDLLADADFFPPNGPEKTGVLALEKADIFNILCIPPFGTDLEYASVISQAVPYCEKRRAICLVDPPTSWNSVKTALDGVDQVLPRSSNAALFFPRLVEPNPLLNSQLQTFVPCGAVAGIFARTDTQRGVWKAPAGIDATLAGVSDLSVHLTDDENGQLNPIGINCLRSFPIVGRVVWGSRTARGADILSDDYKYIPVRRLALYIEESLFRGTKWVVFEPNDEPLWAQIRLNVGAFMQDLFRQGAFQGTTPRDAYFVKCDKETTIQNDINLGIVNIVVGFAPLKPAEFVVIKLQQIAGQIQA